MLNLTTYQDIKMSADLPENAIPPYFIFTRPESRINFATNFEHFTFLFKRKILFRIIKPYFVPYENYQLKTNENLDFNQIAVLDSNEINEVKRKK